ncbi:MAG: hypothetical protein PHV28_17185 [Kiritimatiellae bacterium]|nr:hypothetical protein [Kiritimatiellia bacterium]
MADYITITDALRAEIAKNVSLSAYVGMYEFTFPGTHDFNRWLPDMLNHRERWRSKLISKSDPQALFNQIIQREGIGVRSFPPGALETRSGVYVISDAEEGEVLYIGKCEKAEGTCVAWRLIDHFFPPAYAQQNSPWLWTHHIDVGKKLRAFYCDNMNGSLLPGRIESELIRIACNHDGDYPRYDRRSRFVKPNRQ